MEKEKGVKYFWDSYAIVELINGNVNYSQYISYNVVMSVFNLVEVYWVALNQYGEETADKIYNDFKSAVVKISDSVIKGAVKFRKQNKKRDLSYADCIGYIYALENNLKFLTGDKEFKDLESVEFVK